MKLVHYILAAYLILLAAVPCCAFDDCPDDKTTIAHTADHERGDDDDCGNCSPFFNCEGCASVTINVQSISFAVPAPQQKRVYARFIPSMIPDAHYDFWQPPRAGNDQC
jgi:hypothetical protein